MSSHIIVYASRSLIPPAYAANQIENIVTKARDKNAFLGVTGALIYSEKHFAQVLEGEKSRLDWLMKSISHDPRHTEIVLLRDAPIARRRFDRWTLGYSGPSVYVDQIILRSISESDRASGRGLIELIRLMEEFASVRSR